nr:MAG: hypothetical protein [Microvirus sp.]
MDKKYYTQYATNEDSICLGEIPDPTLLIEHTGVEKLEKTIDRLMVAGMNLYDRDRGAYSVHDPDESNDGMPYMSKWNDTKDVNMRMREIQRRLRNKVRAEAAVPAAPIVNPETGTITEKEPED